MKKILLTLVAAIVTFAATAQTTYTLVGSAGLCGSEWAIADANNDLSGEPSSITKTNVQAGTYQFKIGKNHSWDGALGSGVLNGASTLGCSGTNEGNVQFTTTHVSDITIQVIEEQIYFYCTAPLVSYTLVGEEGLTGISWDPANPANDLTYDETSKTLKTNKIVEAGTYEFKIATNHNWDRAYGYYDFDATGSNATVADASGNISLTIAERSTVTVEFNTVNNKIYINTVATPAKPDIDSYATVAALKAVEAEGTEVMYTGELIVQDIDNATLYCFDATGFIQLFAFSWLDNVTMPAVGDKIALDSILAFDNNAEISASVNMSDKAIQGVRIISSNNTLATPTETTIADINTNSANYNCGYVTLRNVKPVTNPRGATIGLTDGTNQISFGDSNAFGLQYLDSMHVTGYTMMTWQGISFNIISQNNIIDATPTRYIAGNEDLTGVVWSSDDANNKMTYNNGIYTITYTNLQPNTAYEFKITDGTWAVCWSAENVSADCSDQGWQGQGTENIKFMLTQAADVTITFDGTNICLTSTAGSFTTEIAITSYTLVGNAAIFGTEFDVNDNNNNMVENEENIWTKEYTNIELEVGTYNYKVVGNHNYSVWEFPMQSNNELVIEQKGIYDISFTLNLTEAITVLEANALLIRTTNCENIESALVVYSIDGTIYANDTFEIYDITGRCYSNQNGRLPQGIYIVRTANAAAKVVVK